jgi:hypothetical protein
LEIFAYRKDKKNLEHKNPFTGAHSPVKRSSKKHSLGSSVSGGEDEADMDFDVDENWSGTVW